MFSRSHRTNVGNRRLGADWNGAQERYDALVARAAFNYGHAPEKVELAIMRGGVWKDQPVGPPFPRPRRG